MKGHRLAERLAHHIRIQFTLGSVRYTVQRCCFGAAWLFKSRGAEPEREGFGEVFYLLQDVPDCKHIPLSNQSLDSLYWEQLLDWQNTVICCLFRCQMLWFVTNIFSAPLCPFWQFWFMKYSIHITPLIHKPTQFSAVAVGEQDANSLRDKWMIVGHKDEC